MLVYQAMKFLFCILLPLILLSSCIKEVDLNLEKLPEKVVVNGTICPDSTFSVRVSLSSAMTEHKKLVDNATIAVFEDGIFIYNLPNSGNGWYTVPNHPIEGKKYKIEVSVPGFEMVYAETDIPVFPTIVDAWFEKAGEIDSPISTAKNYYSTTTIIFQDDPAKKNYYLPGGGGYKSENSKETDESILTESDLNFNPPFHYFSDALFQGQQKTMTLNGGGYIVHFITPNFDVWEYQQDYEHFFSIVSEEFFKGVKSWTIHKYNQNSDTYVNDPLTLLFIGEPVEMYSNVVGGYGIFAGRNSKFIPVAPHE